MNRHFGAVAGKLAGMVSRLLGWSPDQFWQATPAELAAIFSADEAGNTAPIGRGELEHMMESERNG